LPGKMRDALPLLQRYIQDPRGTNDWRGYEAMGDIFARSNHHGSATDYYRKALPKTPQQPVGKRNPKAEIQLKLADSLGALGKTKEALDLIDSAAAGLARSADLQFRMGKILLKAGKEDDAMRAFDNSIKLLVAELEPIVAADEADVVDLNAKLTTIDEIHRTKIRYYEERFAKAVPAQHEALRRGLARVLADSGENDRNLKISRSILA